MTRRKPNYGPRVTQTIAPQYSHEAEIIATPTAENGYVYVVDAPTYGRLFMSGLGAPRGGDAGDKGRITYGTGAGFGLYFWTPSKGESNG